MKIKQKMKNWIVFISAVILFFFFYIFFALRLGSNVRNNVSQGAISMASAFLKSETRAIDDSISNRCSDSSSDYVLEDGYLKCSVGNEEEGIELSSLFDPDNPLLSSVSISLPGKWTWEKGSASKGDIALSFSLEKTGLEIIYYISSSYLVSSQEKGISLVVRNMIYVAILFITFIVGMAIYTFNREPFAENKNKKTIDRILSAVTEDFVFLVVVDVRTRIEKVFFLSNGPRPKWTGKDKTYDENIPKHTKGKKYIW